MAEQRAATLEQNYVNTRHEVARGDLQCALREVMLLRTTSAKKTLLYQRVFEQGEQTGRLLAWLSRKQSAMSGIANIKNANGQLISDPGGINACFAAFYRDLYSSRARYSTAELQAFLEEVQLPILTEETRRSLDTPLTLKELQQAIGSMQAGKSPGDDGLPAEFYKAYVDTLACRLLEVLSASFETSSPPPRCWRQSL